MMCMRNSFQIIVLYFMPLLHTATIHPHFCPFPYTSMCHFESDIITRLPSVSPVPSPRTENGDAAITVKKLDHTKITMWCGFTAAQFLGPYLLQNIMDSVCCLEMLENYVRPAVSRWRNAQNKFLCKTGHSITLQYFLTVAGWEVPWQMAWLTRSNRMANKKPWPDAMWFLLLGMGKRRGLQERSHKLWINLNNETSFRDCCQCWSLTALWSVMAPC